MHKSFAALCFSGLVAMPSIALACSMAPGYKVPTNLELAAAADTIVIARVISSKAGADRWESSVIATPEALLKGVSLPATVEIAGAHLGNSDWTPTRSNPRELRKANPDALIGGCVRYIFDRDMKLVLFLKRNKSGELVPYRSSFSRDAEDVTDENALWVKTVREYAKISAFPKKEWKARLRSRITELRSNENDFDAMAIANDMEIETKGKRLLPYD